MEGSNGYHRVFMSNHAALHDVQHSRAAQVVRDVKVSFHLTPVVEHMFNELKSSSKLFADETRCPVLDPGRGKTKTGYLWAIARDERPFGGTAPPGVVFCYAPYH